jgi:hypothetical protein
MNTMKTEQTAKEKTAAPAPATPNAWRIASPAAPAAVKPAAPLSILDAVKTLKTAAAADANAPAVRRQNDVARIASELAAVETTLCAALKTDAKTLDALRLIAVEMLKRTDALKLDDATGEPFYGTPAVVFYNAVHAVGTFSQNLDAFRRTLRDLDRVNKTAYLAKFEREFSVYLALKMDVKRDFLDSLSDRDLTITRF